MIFRFYAFRFHFQAIDRVYFPEDKAGNVFRGAFGILFRRIACDPGCDSATTCPQRETCPYARMFEPKRTEGPSGLADPPRPFVIRAAGLNGQTKSAGSLFSIDVHVFAPQDPLLQYFVLAFVQLGREGLGPGRGRVSLLRVELLGLGGAAHGVLFADGAFSDHESPSPLALDLTSTAPPVDRVRVRFLTPTELKGGGQIADGLPFDLLLARLRDRISTLRSLYGDGPLEVDFRGMAERARAVQTVASSLRHAEVVRRSSRTGQTHGVGGFLGEVEYAGNLSEFFPYLLAGRWVGVGRHTVWGNGALEVTAMPVSVHGLANVNYLFG